MVNVKKKSVGMKHLFLCVTAMTMVIVGCKKNNTASEADGYKAIEKTFEDSAGGAEDGKKEEMKTSSDPVQGANLSGLGNKEKGRFEGLVDVLMSPCGKAHSLRTSRNTDASCLRSPFAVAFVIETIKDGASDPEITDVYKTIYKADRQKYGFSLDHSPSMGPSDAQVTLVEFFDYGCPACKALKPVFEKMVADYPGQVSLSYKMYPLPSHVDSAGAAQAAFAAKEQGKFKEMHEMLFANQQEQQSDKLDAYAKKIGLNMKKFKADYAASEPLVAKDKKEGEDAKVHGTPSVYINGYHYEGPNIEKYLKMAIDEAIALSR